MAPLPAFLVKPAFLEKLHRGDSELEHRSTAPVLNDLYVSSVEQDTIVKRDETMPPLALHSLHHREAANVPGSAKSDYGSGAKPATDFNNAGFLALFALIGAGMTVATIWFFFWAKNGGFKWRKHDWDDYKSTVLRRKGPDGKTLSNATKSTKLGGGSVVHSQTTLSDGYTDVTYEEVQEKKRIRGGGGDDRRHRNTRSGRHDAELRDYRHEKPAQVGGLNRQHDGSHWDYTNSERSDLLTASDLSSRPLNPTGAAKPDKRREKAERARRAKDAKDAKVREKEQAKKDKEAAKAAKKKGAWVQKSNPSSSHKDSDTSPSKNPLLNPDTNSPNNTPTKSRKSRDVSNAYSFTVGDDHTEYTGTSYSSPYTATHSGQGSATHPPASDSYYTSYRPNAIPEYPVLPKATSTPPQAQKNSRYHNRASDSSPRRNSGDRERKSHSASPRKSHRHTDSGTGSSSRPHSRTRDGNSHASGDTGTKSYPCHIPGVSSAAKPTISVVQPSVNHGHGHGHTVMPANVVPPSTVVSGGVAPEDSVSQIGTRAQRERQRERERERRERRERRDGKSGGEGAGRRGYRRGAEVRSRGRRDSLSDSGDE
ncbi:hypothetical protein K402DRAFT_394826 [Aulographum hederae CBS 113979]|uniref:Uncharacterized protein n=1 Tax=Aulographum hederae CBS 113979 TaxID=1176131 RepID=A0A6G1GXL0_9PEZI|nr:hypothetical protein K402DRAFT_394826 [Aulographum hederae CBS 113979]